MTTEERELVQGTIESEGMWYTFDSYSKFNEIKDSHFHTAREIFLAAGRALLRYIDTGKKPGPAPRPTMKELQAILDSENPGNVTIQLDGQVTVDPAPPK